MTVNRYLTKRSVFGLVTSAAVLVAGVAFPVGTAQAGVIPWMYDAIFGPVGSMGMGRAYAGYGGYGIGSYYSGYSPMISSGFAPTSPYSGSYGNAGAGCSSCQSSLYAPSFSGYSSGYVMTDGYGSFAAPVMGDGFCSSGCGTPGAPCSINAAPLGPVTPSPDPGPSRTRTREYDSRPSETRDMRPVTPPRANDNFREPLETDGFRSRSNPRGPATFDDETPGTSRPPARTPGNREPMTPGAGSGTGRGTGTGTGFPDDPDFGDSAPVRKPVTPRNPVETNKPVIEEGNGEPQSNTTSPRMPAPMNEEDVREGRHAKSAVAFGEATPLNLDNQRTVRSGVVGSFDRQALSAKFAAPKLVRVQSKPEVWADAPVPTKLARQ
jgi:hypothetical protein